MPPLETDADHPRAIQPTMRCDARGNVAAAGGGRFLVRLGGGVGRQDTEWKTEGEQGSENQSPPLKFHITHAFSPFWLPQALCCGSSRVAVVTTRERNRSASGGADRPASPVDNRSIGETCPKRSLLFDVAPNLARRDTVL